MFGPDRVSGARICFSRVPEGRRETVLERLVSGPETRCITADKVLSVPAGIWHYYVVADDPYLVSTHPTEMLRPGASSDSEEISRVVAELVPAATVHVEKAAKALREGELLALYVTHRGSDVSAPALVPVSPGVTEMPVPSRTPVIPLVLRDGRITAVGNELTLDTGTADEVVFPVRTKATVVVPYRLPAGTGGTASATIRAIRSTAPTAFGQHEPQKADWRGLMFLRDVREGKVNLVVDSDTLTASPLSVTVPAEATVITTADLILRSAPAQTTVSWSIDPAFAADLKVPVECESFSVDARPPRRLRLYKCPRPNIRRPAELATCSMLRDEVLPDDATSGEVRFPSAEMGEAVLELRAHMISVFEPLFVNEGKPTVASIHLAPRSIQGRVTSRRGPVQGVVECGGPSQLTEPGGRYRCWRPVEAMRVITFQPCDGSAPYEQEFAADAEMLDIEIPDNTVRVEVLAAETGKPLAEAMVALWHGRISAGEVEPPSTSLGPTGESGAVTASRLEPRRDASICAMKPGYVRACRDSVDVHADSDLRITLTLQKETSIDGTIAAPAEIIDGRLFVMNGPLLIEDVPVLRSGTFGLRAMPPAGSSFILITQTLPLCVLEPLGPGTVDLRLRVPQLQPVSFVVRSIAKRTPITLELGGVLIPSYAFSRHQGMRRAQYVVDPAHPLEVTQIDGGRGVTIVVGAVASLNAAGDPLKLPRYPLGASNEVTLPE
jgi:hypothetical protein